MPILFHFDCHQQRQVPYISLSITNYIMVCSLENGSSCSNMSTSGVCDTMYAPPTFAAQQQPIITLGSRTIEKGSMICRKDEKKKWSVC
mmetsp:Transcript_8722/g.12674  ORF Transcript_8722/g.12674 Transcript_8722/m.12674 type:complete len:89 (+) Transcript_8722:325-591(+)